MLKTTISQINKPNSKIGKGKWPSPEIEPWLGISSER